MRLYSGTSIEFISDTQHRIIVSKLTNAFRQYYRVEPQLNEIKSWENSLREVSKVFQDANLIDHGVLLEYQLPLTSKRLDCLICGKDKDQKDNAVIIELKQWEETHPSDGENEVSTWLNGEIRDILHPSAQVGAYKEYLQGCHSAFTHTDSIGLYACSYLHNYKASEVDPILDKKFSQVLSFYPLFMSEQKKGLEEFLQSRLSSGQGISSLTKIEYGGYKPARKLMDYVFSIISHKSEYILLDEQLIVFDKVFSLLKEAYKTQKKSAIIVKGGPGTGKSVIAINLLARLLKQGVKANYLTGSRSFNETLWSKLGHQSKVFIKYFNSFMDGERDIMDCLICDEAHRIRERSENKNKVLARVPQLYEILRAARVSVFFVDDNQIVKPGEIGSIQFIEEYSKSKNVTIYKYELESQFRCNGSDSFVNWINNTLDIKRTANVIWSKSDESFDFRIFDSPEALENAIIQKDNEGFSARISAGFCWKWSDPVNGELIKDVVIGDYRRPWNMKPNAAKIIKDVPPASLWASDKRGIYQIGCVYTAQGFEYDYAGIIFGKDLVYRFSDNTWRGIKSYSRDPSMRNVDALNFLEYVKNTYRVLLTRGMKGCYVYFEDEETANFVRSRME